MSSTITGVIPAHAGIQGSEVLRADEQEHFSSADAERWTPFFNEVTAGAQLKTFRANLAK